MSLDILLDPVPERNMTRPCKVTRIIESLEEPYKSALIELVDRSFEDGGLTAEELEHRMKIAELEVGSTVIRKHRKQQCSCEKKK